MTESGETTTTTTTTSKQEQQQQDDQTTETTTTNKNESSSSSSSSSAASSFRFMLLSLMVLQNSSTVLVGRYTRNGPTKEEMYVVNHLIIVTEFMKLVLSCILEYKSTQYQLIKSLQENILNQPYDALKISIPSLLYLVQNTLLYVALTNLSAPIFQVTYQGKLLTTALVSVFLLQRKYTMKQWICLTTLGLGVAIVVLGEKNQNNNNNTHDNDEHSSSSLIITTTATTATTNNNNNNNESSSYSFITKMIWKKKKEEKEEEDDDEEHGMMKDMELMKPILPK